VTRRKELDQRISLLQCSIISLVVSSVSSAPFLPALYVLYSFINKNGYIYLNPNKSKWKGFSQGDLTVLNRFVHIPFFPFPCKDVSPFQTSNPHLAKIVHATSYFPMREVCDLPLNITT